MLNIMKADFYRMRRSKVVYILFAIMTMCAIGGTVSSYLMEHATLSPKFIQQASGFADMLTIVVAGPFLAGLVICSDFQSKTIHDSILYAKGRKKVVFSKIVLYCEMIMLLLLPYAICAIVGFLSQKSFSVAYSHSLDSVFFTILANEGCYQVNASNVLKLLAIMITILLVYASRMSLNILLVYVIKKPVIVVGAGIAIQMILSLLGLMTLTSEVADSILGWTPFASYGAVLSLNASWGRIIKAAGMSLVFISIVNQVTGGIFEKADIK